MAPYNLWLAASHFSYRVPQAAWSIGSATGSGSSERRSARVSVPSAIPAASVSFHASHPEKVMTHAMKLMRVPSNVDGRDECSSVFVADTTMMRTVRMHGICVKGRMYEWSTWRRLEAKRMRYSEKKSISQRVLVHVRTRGQSIGASEPRVSFGRAKRESDGERSCADGIKHSEEVRCNGGLSVAPQRGSYSGGATPCKVCCHPIINMTHVIRPASR